MNISLKATAILLVVALLIGLGLGAWAMHTWQVSGLQVKLAALAAELSATKSALTTEQQKAPVIISQKGDTVTETKIAYVPKETIIYRDAAGKEATGTESADLQATGKTNFNMLLNGKPVQFTKSDDEKFMFEKNKLTWDQAANVTVNTDIRPMLEEYARTRAEAERSYFSTGGYLSNLGAAVSLGFVPKKNIEYKVIATVPDTSKFRGGGVEWHF